MIRINLLPVEKRKAERTPVPRFFMIVATAGLAAGIAFYIMYVVLAIRAETERIMEKQAAFNRLLPQIEEFDRWSKRKKEAEGKYREITSVITRDMEIGYWRAVNAIWDVIHNHRKVWIDDLKVMDAKAAAGEMKRHYPDSRESPPYAITMRCHVAGSEVKEMTRFREALKNDPVLAGCLPVINYNPDWKVDEEKDFAERYSISFSVALFGVTEKPAAPAAAKRAPARGGPK